MAHKAERLIKFCFIVYMATNRVNQKKYVGKSSYPLSYRKAGHKSAGDANRGSVFHRAIRKHGWENFEFVVLYEGVNEQEINIVERAMIAQYDTFVPKGYNVTLGGEGAVGICVSAETRAKLSAAGKGRKRPDNIVRLKGKKHSPEFGAKISAAKKGKPLHPNTRAAQLIAVTGKTPSAETRAKLSAALTGGKRTLTPEGLAAIAAKNRRIKHARGRAVICVTNDTIYASSRFAAADLKINESHICAVLHGRLPHAKEHMFVYADSAGEPSYDASNKRRKQVVCLDTGKKFRSMRDAAKFCGGQACAISQAVKTGHRVKGFRFAVAA